VDVARRRTAVLRDAGGLLSEVVPVAVTVGGLLSVGPPAPPFGGEPVQPAAARESAATATSTGANLPIIAQAGYRRLGRMRGQAMVSVAKIAASCRVR
jgi:hypothetical protein